ncbi:MAG: hypothetical protein JW996_01480 [Candidatus Cloacimonetes bacterium]|nr:hypothetical protein [Candidatus Cloacimonadota bacterium]
MGRLVLIFVVLLAGVFAVIVTNVQQKSEALPEMLNKNFKDIGSYALQYAINQVNSGEVIETTSQVFSGDDEFKVLNGTINSIQYTFLVNEGYEIDLGGGDQGGGGGNQNSGYHLEGDLSINPGNSSNNEFTMQTPSGTIDRSFLHSMGASYSYNGEATSIKIKVKAQGRDITINGVDITLSTNTRYTITSQSMTVDLRNSNPNENNTNKAMGRWWIAIIGDNVDIDPLPEGDYPEEEDDDDSYVIDPFVQEVNIIADITMTYNGKDYDHTSEVLMIAGGGAIDFDIGENGGIIVHEDVSATIQCLGEAFADAVVQMSYSLDGGQNFASLWDNMNVQGGESYLIEQIDAESEIALKATWQDTRYYWRSGTEVSNSGNQWVDVYRDGDQAPNYVPYGNQAGAEEFMSPYLSESGEVTLGENDAIFLFELGKGTWDYQDVVMLITFSKETEIVDNGFLDELENMDTSLKIVYWRP